MNRTGIVTDDLFIQHDPGAFHPESPDRLRSIHRAIEESGLRRKLQAVAPRPATVEEITRIHTRKHYERVESTEGREVALDADTQTSAASFRAALLAAGGTCALVEAVVRGDLENGFALVRPPGHHAERDRAMGFCLFNNLAIAAQHARVALGVERVMIVDWDLHHGNGTMHAFQDRQDVLFCSTHQYPFYPGTGGLTEVGTGSGAGYTINVPLPPGMGNAEYCAIFQDIFRPVAEQFAPQLLLVSAGFDIYRQDPLGGMKVSAEGFGLLTSELMAMAAASAERRVVLVLEGGYHLEGEAQGVVCCLQSLLGESPPLERAGELSPIAQRVIAQVRKTHSHRWSF